MVPRNLGYLVVDLPGQPKESSSIPIGQVTLAIPFICDTPMQECAIYGLAVLTIILVTEYVVHRWVLHRLARCLRRFARLQLQQKAHAHDHHGKSDNSLELIDLPVKNWLWAFFPAILLATPYDYRLAIIMTLGCVCHSVGWSILHRACHDLGYGRLKSWPITSSLIEHHLAHHAHPNRNFGALFGPVMDCIMRTRYFPANSSCASPGEQLPS
ncbi:MAG: sterol desaturase family protein [Planctomycetota bacterium]